MSLGQTIVKHTARKVRKIHGGTVLGGFAGAGADTQTLFDKFESSLQQYSGNLMRAAVEVAKDWRHDRVLRRLEALIVADTNTTLLLSGSGDLIEPDDGMLAIGTGGNFALAAARALARHTKLDAAAIARDAMRIASEICVYTNANVTVEELP